VVVVRGSKECRRFRDSENTNLFSVEITKIVELDFIRWFFTASGRSQSICNFSGSGFTTCTIENLILESEAKILIVCIFASFPTH
jgi:hypothetical protein